MMIPAEFFYDIRNAARTKVEDCDVFRWEHESPLVPTLTQFLCENETKLSGINEKSFKVYPDKDLRIFDEYQEAYSVWFPGGVYFEMTFRDNLLIVGDLEGISEIETDVPEEIHWRNYTLWNSFRKKDEHIGGTAIDLGWTADEMQISPALMAVVSCDLESAFVDYHTHTPEGALYIPLVGDICFEGNCTDENIVARWVAPNYRYSEKFLPSSYSPMVDYIYKRKCKFPFMFLVEGFDYMRENTWPDFENIPSDTTIVYRETVEVFRVTKS